MPEKNKDLLTIDETLYQKGFQEKLGIENSSLKTARLSQYFGILVKYWEKSLGRQTVEICFT